jgi:adenosine deaminase
MHAGEVGGPEKIREAVEILGVERIGHGIAAIHDPALMELLAKRRIPLEVCPTSNLRTGALGVQLRNPEAVLEQHPLPQLVRRGVSVVISTDDPAMFHATLLGEYEVAAKTGLTEAELVALHRAGFEHAFLPQDERCSYLAKLP